MKFDYLIVGCGLYGAAFANRAKEAGKKCLILERRSHVAGNCYTNILEDIQIHRYGAHIFHTSNKAVWDFVLQFADFKPFINSPLANWRGEIYNLPFNMNTFHQMWGVKEPDEARQIIERQRAARYTENPKNLEEQAINMVGTDIYEKLIRGYTKKQWGRDCCELPPFIIKRLPIRFTYDNNYFNDIYQGIPVDGYTAMVERMIEGIDIELETDYLRDKNKWNSIAERIVYTGSVDEYFDFCLGALQYRSLRFESEVLDIPDYQSNAVVNYTDAETPFTRIIEHKHFLTGNQPKTVITKEYPIEWTQGLELYYPINDKVNTELYDKYSALAKKEPKITFCGRLGEYKYYDMDKVIEQVLAGVTNGFN